MDFSEARDLFVNIFRILDRTEKFVDRGLILENPRGLSEKSEKSGPRVDFTKVQGPLCKISEISEITNYFLTDNSRPGPRLRGPAGRARSTVDRRRRGQRAWRRAHQSSTSGRSGASKLAGGGVAERGAHGELD